MARVDRSGIVLHTAEAAYSVLILAWYVLPFVLPEHGQPAGKGWDGVFRLAVK